MLTDLDEVFIDGKAFDLTDTKNDVTKIQELFRSYVQGLDLLAL